MITSACVPTYAGTFDMTTDRQDKEAGYGRNKVADTQDKDVTYGRNKVADKQDKEATYVRNKVADILKKDSVHARSIAEDLLRKDRKNPDLAAAIGTAFLHAGRLEDAEYFYDKGYHMKRISTTVINLAGDIAYAKNDTAKAAYYYGRAIYFDKRDAQGYYKYARLYAKTNPEKSVQKLSQLKVFHKEVAVDLKIASIYYDANQFQAAARTYAALPADSLDKESLTSYALSYYFLQQFDSALVVARQGQARFPRHPALNRMLLYNHTELKHYDEALQAAQHLFHQSDDAEFQYLDYIYYAYALNGLGRYDEAIAQFNRVMELNPDRKDVIKAIADAYEKIEDYDHAISYYTQYLDKLEADEKTAFEVYHLGYLYYAKGTSKKDSEQLTADKQAALEEADRLYAQVEQMRPDSYLGAYWRARTNVALDPTSEKGLARSHYMKVINLLAGKSEHTPQLLESYKYLTYYYYLKKDKVSALIYIDKIMDIDPTDNYAIQISNAL